MLLWSRELCFCSGLGSLLCLVLLDGGLAFLREGSQSKLIARFLSFWNIYIRANGLVSKFELTYNTVAFILEVVLGEALDVIVQVIQRLPRVIRIREASPFDVELQLTFVSVSGNTVSVFHNLLHFKEAISDGFTALFHRLVCGCYLVFTFLNYWRELF